MIIEVIIIITFISFIIIGLIDILIIYKITYVNHKLSTLKN